MGKNGWINSRRKKNIQIIKYIKRQSNSKSTKFNIEIVELILNVNRSIRIIK
jgi:hypothetical protein